MSSSPKATQVRFDADTMRVDLDNASTLTVPLAWFPRLLNASPDQRNQVRISSRGLHWDSLDEDISIEGLIAGRRDQTNRTHIHDTIAS